MRTNKSRLERLIDALVNPPKQEVTDYTIGTRYDKSMNRIPILLLADEEHELIGISERNKPNKKPTHHLKTVKNHSLFKPQSNAKH